MFPVSIIIDSTNKLVEVIINLSCKFPQSVFNILNGCCFGGGGAKEFLPGDVQILVTPLWVSLLSYRTSTIPGECPPILLSDRTSHEFKIKYHPGIMY